MTESTTDQIANDAQTLLTSLKKTADLMQQFQKHTSFEGITKTDDSLRRQIAQLLIQAECISDCKDAIWKWHSPSKYRQYTDASGNDWKIFQPYSGCWKVEPDFLRSEKVPESLFVELGKRLYNNRLDDKPTPEDDDEIIAIIDKHVPYYYVDGLGNPWKIWRTDDLEEWRIEIYFCVKDIPNDLGANELFQRECGRKPWFESREQAIAFIEQFIPKKAE